MIFGWSDVEGLDIVAKCFMEHAPLAIWRVKASGSVFLLIGVGFDQHIDRRVTLQLGVESVIGLEVGQTLVMA